MLRRGDIYWVDLNPTSGSEIRKRRPCVIVSATPINQARRTVVVVPLSSSGRPHPPLTTKVKCMGREVVAVCDQIRAVDKVRLIEHIESIGKEDITEIENGLRQVLSI